MSHDYLLDFNAFLHDLAVSVSSLNATFSLIDHKRLDKETNDVLIRGRMALEQTNRIISGGRQVAGGDMQKSSFSPHEHILRVINLFDTLLVKHSVKVSVPNKIDAEIYGYDHIFERVISNVLQNSVEELAEVSHECKIKIVYLVEGSKLYIKILDNGRGIEEGKLRLIFENNYTTKKGENRGLGLSFVRYAMVNSFDGEVEVKSDQGSGTEISLIFPILS